MSVVSTVVDRITPAVSPGGVRELAAASGLDDACPVVCESYAEWALGGR